MYQHYYEMREIPFSLAPDPKYLFRTESLLEVFANLQYGIENGKGLIVVTGEVGVGKTTILRSLFQSLDRSVLAAYIFNPLLSTSEFFDLLAGEFRLRSEPSKSAMLRMLGYVFMSRHAQGRRTVLVVDEAHLLPAHLLEEVRLLLNFETNREKLLQVVLCGQPELHDMLERPEFRQLKQRVSLKCSIEPLTRHETIEYIRWRLRVAGAKNENLFESEAVRAIHRYSGGIPRVINNICDNALLTGFGAGSRRVTRPIIDQVAELLDLTPIEVTPQTTAAAAAGHSGAGNGSNPVPSAGNGSRSGAEVSFRSHQVHYIRRDSSDSTNGNSSDAGGPMARPVDAPVDGESPDPSVFFSRVRVDRRF